MDALGWLKKIRSLPFLMEIADAKGGDRYAVMAALRDEYEARGEVYVWTTIYRTPPGPCSTGEHTVSSATYELVRPGIPGKHGRLMVSEKVLHEIEFHGRHFQPDQVRKLEAIFEGRL